jgi:hypothetical protein
MKILTIISISISIVLIASFFLYNKSNGVYKTTMRVDKITIRVDETNATLSQFFASKIDGELEVYGGGLGGNKYYEDLFLSKVKEGDTIDVIMNENNRTTIIYCKKIIVFKCGLPLDWEIR